MAATRFTTQLLINGHSVAGEGRVEPILNPSTGELLCEVREASADHQASSATVVGIRSFRFDPDQGFFINGESQGNVR